MKNIYQNFYRIMIFNASALRRMRNSKDTKLNSKKQEGDWKYCLIGGTDRLHFRTLVCNIPPYVCKMTYFSGSVRFYKH